MMSQKSALQSELFTDFKNPISRTVCSTVFDFELFRNCKFRKNTCSKLFRIITPRDWILLKRFFCFEFIYSSLSRPPVWWATFNCKKFYSHFLKCFYFVLRAIRAIKCFDQL